MIFTVPIPRDLQKIEQNLIILPLKSCVRHTINKMFRVLYKNVLYITNFKVAQLNNSYEPINYCEVLNTQKQCTGGVL